jgi:L-rhamnose 1-dehydrogenase
VNYHDTDRHVGDQEFGHDNEADAASVVEQIEALGRRGVAVRADVADSADVRTMVETTVDALGGLDILANNAGICPFADFLDLPEDLWDRVHAVNLKGTFLCSQAAARVMVAQGRGGRIIGMSSISALVGGARQTHYTPTKAGVHALMQSMAIALGPHGITCNSVMPGAIATDINADDWSDPGKRAALDRRIPLGRFGEPDDIGGPVVFLASDAARYVTGASILVDGGLFVNLQ